MRGTFSFDVRWRINLAASHALVKDGPTWRLTWSAPVASEGLGRRAHRVRLSVGPRGAPPDSRGYGRRGRRRRFYAPACVGARRARAREASCCPRRSGLLDLATRSPLPPRGCRSSPAAPLRGQGDRGAGPPEGSRDCGVTGGSRSGHRPSRCAKRVRLREGLRRSGGASAGTGSLAAGCPRDSCRHGVRGGCGTGGGWTPNRRRAPRRRRHAGRRSARPLRETRRQGTRPMVGAAARRRLCVAPARRPLARCRHASRSSHRPCCLRNRRRPRHRGAIWVRSRSVARVPRRGRARAAAVDRTGVPAPSQRPSLRRTLACPSVPSPSFE